MGGSSSRQAPAPPTPPPPPPPAPLPGCWWDPWKQGIACPSPYVPPPNVPSPTVSPILPNDPINVYTDELGRPEWPDNRTIGAMMIGAPSSVQEQTYQARAIIYDANASRLRGIMNADSDAYNARESENAGPRNKLSNQRDTELNLITGTRDTANKTHGSMMSKYGAWRADYGNVVKKDAAVQEAADNTTSNLRAAVYDDDGDVGDVCRRVLQIRDSVDEGNGVIRDRIGTTFLTKQGIALPSITSPQVCAV